MTIMATHFALVLGAWRLRIRIDIDEPREADLHEDRMVNVCAPGNDSANRYGAARHAATWGRG